MTENSDAINNDLMLSFSSISLAGNKIERFDEILWPHSVQKSIARRAKQLKETLTPVFGEENIGVSLHPAMVVDPFETSMLLKKSRIPITSIDVPDVIPPQELVEKVIKSVRTNDGRAFNHLGWSLQNAKK